MILYVSVLIMPNNLFEIAPGKLESVILNPSVSLEVAKPSTLKISLRKSTETGSSATNEGRS